MNKSIIIDTDAGIDDIVSILMTLQHPGVSFKALTVVHGNVPLKRGLENAKFINDLIQQGHMKTSKRIPIYAGCAGPLIQGLHPIHLWEGHGPDGLGGFTLSEEFAKFQPDQTSKQVVEKEHAATALIQLVNDNPGIHLLALGPLTNIATAITLDPLFLSKLGSLVIMGGSLVAQGNSNRAAEFNFHSDPEAAHIVLEASLKLDREKPVVQLVPWETCMDHKLPWSFYDEIARADSTLSKILRGITVRTESMLRDKFQLPQDSDHALDVYIHSLHQFLFPDIYATLVLLDEGAILKYQDWDIAVELEGRYSRGGCFVEWIPGDKKMRNARVVSALSTARLEDVLRRTFLSASSP